MINLPVSKLALGPLNGDQVTAKVVKGGPEAVIINRNLTSQCCRSRGINTITAVSMVSSRAIQLTLSAINRLRDNPTIIFLGNFLSLPTGKFFGFEQLPRTGVCTHGIIIGFVSLATLRRDKRGREKRYHTAIVRIDLTGQCAARDRASNYVAVRARWHRRKPRFPPEESATPEDIEVTNRR